MGVSETFSLKKIKIEMAKPKVKTEASSQQVSAKTKSEIKSEDSFSGNIEEWINKAKKLASEAKSLEELSGAVENFEGLAIKKTATKCVFSDGNPKSNLMLIGEAPGENEDEQGIPFCGVSGRLLDNMLNFAGFTRAKNFYITNTVFWRPPGNRKPTPEEIAMCKPFVEKHIALINPKAIILIGATATFSVLNSKESISLLKKTVHNYHSEVLGKDIPCFAIYHPSYLLRQPSQKKISWLDILKIKKFLEN
jgi:DNA polymerase